MFFYWQFCKKWLIWLFEITLNRNGLLNLNNCIEVTFLRKVFFSSFLSMTVVCELLLKICISYDCLFSENDFSCQYLNLIQTNIFPIGLHSRFYFSINNKNNKKRNNSDKRKLIWICPIKISLNPKRKLTSEWRNELFSVVKHSSIKRQSLNLSEKNKIILIQNVNENKKSSATISSIHVELSTATEPIWVEQMFLICGSFCFLKRVNNSHQYHEYI